MSNRIVASLFAAALLTLGLFSTASAQTAGGRTLEGVRDLVKSNFNYTLASEGRQLFLTSRSAASATMELTLVDNDLITFNAVLGNVTKLNATTRDIVRQKIALLNTTLPVGTFVEQPNGDIQLFHHIRTNGVSPSAIIQVVNAFSSEVSRRRAELFS